MSGRVCRGSSHHGRRAFIGALGLVPWLATGACGGSDDAGAPAPEEGLSSAERDRYRSLAEDFVAALSAHDLELARDFFSGSSALKVNGEAVDDVGQFLVEFGASQSGGLREARMSADRFYFTADALLLEGVLGGKHEGSVAGFPATNTDVDLAYMAFCKFDDSGKFASLDMIMNLLLLIAPPSA